MEGAQILPIAFRRDLPTVGGVYWVTVADLGVVYVGSTGCLRTRWSKHNRLFEIETLGPSEIHYLPMDDPDARLALEEAEIRRLRPRLNRNWNGPQWKTVNVPFNAAELERVDDFHRQFNFPSRVAAIRYLLETALS